MLGLSKLCHIVLLTFIILYIGFIVLYAPAIHMSILDGSDVLLLWIHIIGTWSLDLVISIIILLHFVIKLRKSVIMIYANNDAVLSINSSVPSITESLNNNNNNNNNKSITIQDTNKLLQIISKTCILSITLITSTQLVLILQITDFLFHCFHMQNIRIICVYVAGFYTILDGIIKSICISMFFVFTNKCYIILCRCIDTKIKECCFRCIQTDINNRR